MNPQFKIGDRVTCNFHKGEPATITHVEHAENGDVILFDYMLDRPHELGPRHGVILNGTAIDTSRWRHLEQDE